MSTAIVSEVCPSFSTYLPYENYWLVDDAARFFNRNWTFCLCSIAVYLMGVFYGRKYMEDKKPFNLQFPLFLWNLALAVFSIVGAQRLIYDMYFMLSTYGVKATHLTHTHKIAGCNFRAFWLLAFTLSKIVEFGDTAFIVLRKKPLRFLHWYHHVTVLLLTWKACAEEYGPGRYFIAINFFVHSLMYSYYALQAIQIRVPKSIAMTITTLQISQMIAGMVIVGYSTVLAINGEEKRIGTISLAGIIYASYFVLFANFFYKTYISKKEKKQ